MEPGEDPDFLEPKVVRTSLQLHQFSYSHFPPTCPRRDKQGRFFRAIHETLNSLINRELGGQLCQTVGIFMDKYYLEGVVMAGGVVGGAIFSVLRFLSVSVSC